MASPSIKPSYMELWREPGIAKPEPLRIVKERAKTVAGYTSSRDFSGSRRGSSRSIDASESPPEDLFRSFTIKKKRRDRGSVLCGSFGQSSCYNSYNSDARHPNEYNCIDYTFGRRSLSARTASVGSFLQSELLRGSSDAGTDIGGPPYIIEHARSATDAFNPLDTVIFPPFKHDDLNRNPDLYANGLRRKKSNGKQLLKKAFNSFGSARSKSMHFLRSKPSKESLKRHTSLPHHDPSRATSGKNRSFNSSRFSFEAESECCTVANADVKSTASPLGGQTLPTPSFILYPEITVVPEVKSVDSGDDERIWVAVLVTGVLQPTNGPPSETDRISNLEKPRNGLGRDFSDDGVHGYLHGLDVKLAARSGSRLEEVIADPYRSRTLQPGQTELILARVKLNPVKRDFSYVQYSTAELIAELESQLGNTITDYLAIGVSYRHSAFPTYRDSEAASMGMSYYGTTTRTEAHAIINRHCSRSSWSVHDKRGTDIELECNPIIPLIRAHYSGAEAEDLIRRVTRDSRSSVHTRRKDMGSDISCTTAVPIKEHDFADVENTPPLSPRQSLDITEASIYDRAPILGPVTPEQRNKLDPARQIWTEMRKSSRGAHRHGLEIIKGAVSSPEVRMGEASRAAREKDLELQKEKARIMEMVLRNKRSMGADTLRSIALPAASMGLGNGRGWGWGPPWW